jgi:hypothetical protein
MFSIWSAQRFIPSRNICRLKLGQSCVHIKDYKSHTFGVMKHGTGWVRFWGVIIITVHTSFYSKRSFNMITKKCKSHYILDNIIF